MAQAHSSTGLSLRKWVVAFSMLAGSVSAVGPGSVALADLPPEALTTQRSILAGGPFPYAKDGLVFGNREKLLPPKRHGYYREYTVPTPGSHDRGAQRIVCGGVVRTAPDSCYYTRDHYASFLQIAQ